MASDALSSLQVRLGQRSRSISPGGLRALHQDFVEKAERKKEAKERKAVRMKESKQLQLFGLCAHCCEFMSVAITYPLEPVAQVDHFKDHVTLVKSTCPLCVFVGGLPIDGQCSQGRAKIVSIYNLIPTLASYDRSNPRALLTFQSRSQTAEDNQRNKESPYVAAGTFGLLHPTFLSDEIRPRHVDPTALDFSIVKKWLNFCKTHHSMTCGSTTGDQVKGLKLIDCITRAVIQADNTSRYVALSYVWGAVRLPDLEKGTFPATIEDSILITLELGYQYLWVDKYVSILCWSYWCLVS